jgi:hypothetical protein
MKIVKFLLEIIKENPGKILVCSLILIGISILHAYWNKPYTDSGHVYDEFQQSGKYYYSVLANGETNPKIISFDYKQTVKDNYMTWHETHPALFITFIILIIIVILSIAGLSSGDYGWEFRDIWTKISIKEILCYEEEGKFKYVYNGKLISQTDFLLSAYNIRDAFEQYLRNPNHYPKYENKQEKRDRLINKLIS